MNERIRQFLEQSGLQPYYDAQEGQIEKFAELIVQECASIVENQGRFLPYLVLSKEVKKKFGIKE